MPAVTVPPSLKAGRSFARASSEVSARGPSSSATRHHGAPPGVGGSIDRFDLGGEGPGRDRGHRPAMALQGEGVLVLPGDPVALGHHLGGHPQADGRVAPLHLGVHQAPAQHGVHHLRLAHGEPRGRLEHHVRGPGHRLRPAGDHHLTPAVAQGLGGRDHRLQAAAAEAVVGGPGHLHREAGQQRRHPGHVAVVLAGLVGRSPVDVFDRRRVHSAAGDEAAEGVGRQIVGTNVGQAPTDLPHRSAAGIDDEHCGHRPPPSRSRAPPTALAHSTDGPRRPARPVARPIREPP